MTATAPNRELLITAEYKFHFLDDNGQVKFTNVNVGDFHAKPPKGGHSWGLRNIPRQKVVNSLRADGSLLVHCQIELLPDPCKMRSQTTERLFPNSEKELATVSKTYVRNMLQLLHEGGGASTDYTVVAEENGQCFPVHKCILAAHSDVFRVMFEHTDTIESECNTLRIKEFPAEAIDAMLEFIYTGCVPSSLACRPEELLGIAEKYNLPYLKTCCEEKLIAAVRKDNAFDMLVLADMYRSHSLKEVVMTCVANNRKDVVNLPGWMHLKEKHPALLNEVLQYLLDMTDGEPSVEAKRPRLE